MRKEFDEQIELNRQWFAQRQAEAQGQPLTLKVGIILIEFKDVKHYKTTQPPNLRPNGYFTSDFDSMMFSFNYWVAPISNNIHPEGEEIFGSFRDYWDQMSSGKLKITGKVVNPTDENGVPTWLTADSTREYYANLPGIIPHISTLALEAIKKADSLGYISENPDDSNYYDKYAIVYAQEGIEAGALYIHAQSINGKYHFISERSGSEIYGSGKSFTHIGIYAHEFGHTIGFYDEYTLGGTPGDNGDTDLFNFDLMARGIYNGPGRKGACPSTLSPWYRIEYEWLPQPKRINSDSLNFTIDYDYANPKLYKIVPVGIANDMHYLLEVKKRQGFDTYIPEPPETYPNQSGTLLIWQHNIEGMSAGHPYQDRIRVKTADFVLNKETQLNDFFPSSTYQNYQSLNDTTFPTASLGNYGEEIAPSVIRPAHFALNGIQKLTNGDTQIGEIKLNHAIVKNKNESGFQNVSVPVGLQSYTLSSVFPTAINAYKFDPILGYVSLSELNSENGYWINFPSQPLNLILQGTVKDYFEISVIGGFNLIGTISDKVAIPKVCSDPPEILGPIYYFQPNKGYVLMTSQDSLYPGLAYWIYTYESGTLFFERFSEPCDLLKVTNTHEINFSDMDKFTIVDTEGNSQSLYVANIDIDTSLTNVNLDLPPFFPEVNFDSRFEYNEFVKKVSADSGTIDLNILVQTRSFPVTLSWELNPENGINYSFISDSVQGKLSTIMSKSGDISFASLSDNKIKLWASTDYLNPMLELPTEYALQQNYPNPFNPATVIRYELPQDGLVTIKVFDILGKEVTTLVNENKSAGRYTVNFDGSNLASGVYIYRFSSGDFISSKKMMLVK